MLIESGANVNAKGNDGETPMHQAAMKNAEGALTVLLNRGAHVDSRLPLDGSTALHQAVERNAGRAVAVLLEHGANIDATANDGWTPLHTCIVKSRSSYMFGIDCGGCRCERQGG